MSVTVKPAPVKKSVTVEAPIEQAFQVFTEGFGRWWPRSNSIGKSPIASAVIEPRTGGRWYEVGQDGAECEWGEVLAWDPPNHLLLVWRIGANWQFDSELHTEVDVRFVAVSDGVTRVDLEHRLLENMGDAAESARQTFESENGWSAILASFAASVLEAHG